MGTSAECRPWHVISACSECNATRGGMSRHKHRSPGYSKQAVRPASALGQSRYLLTSGLNFEGPIEDAA